MSPRATGKKKRPAKPRSPLAGVIGRTRAAILALLELPMSTTQLATVL